MQTDKGGQQGPRSTRDPPPSGSNQRYRQPERGDRDNGNNNNNSNGNGNNDNSSGIAPAVPNFGFQFPAMPNGFQFPPGFFASGAMNTQPPPPGAS